MSAALTGRKVIVVIATILVIVRRSPGTGVVLHWRARLGLGHLVGTRALVAHRGRGEKTLGINT